MEDGNDNIDCGTGYVREDLLEPGSTMLGGVAVVLGEGYHNLECCGGGERLMARSRYVGFMIRRRGFLRK